MKTPRIKADKIIRLVEKLGFNLVRQSGSHKIFRNDKGGRITIPFHSKKVLHPKLINQVIKDLDLTREEFVKLLK